jgi:hypothetical protein
VWWVKCGEVLQCSDGPSNKVSNSIRRHTDNRKLLRVCILLLSHSFLFFRFCFLSMYIWLYFLFSAVIYVFLLLCLRILSSCQLALFGYPDRFFRAFSSVVRQMPGLNPQSWGTAHTKLPTFLRLSVYFLCVNVYWMCTVLLPPGGYPTAVKKYINISISALRTSGHCLGIFRSAIIFLSLPQQY